MGEHRYLALAGEVGRGADVIGVKVRKRDPPQVGRLLPGLDDGIGEQARRAGEAGVDEGQPVGILPQVGVPDRQADEEQAR